MAPFFTNDCAMLREGMVNKNHTIIDEENRKGGLNTVVQ